MAEPKASKPSEGAMRVDTDLIRELAELLSANELTEIEVEDGDRKIKVRREAAPIISAPAAAYSAPAQR
jgi:acetyl-CoA carboxylase biotin carboxyl carrier protein